MERRRFGVAIPVADAQLKCFKQYVCVVFATIDGNSA